MNIQLARPTEIDPLSLTLARAFYRDPVQCWLFPDASHRVQKCQCIFGIFLRNLIVRQTVFTTPRLEGAALWIPPEHVRLSWRKQLELGLQILPILGSNIPRGIQWRWAIEAKQPRYPHWYLFILGTAPEHQRKGVGTALLVPVLQRCDREQLPAYLESGSENLPFYRRSGFEVMGTITLPKGPTVFQMWRQPRGSLSSPAVAKR